MFAALQKSEYRDPSYLEFESVLEKKTAEGLSTEKLAFEIEKIFAKQNRILPQVSFHKLDPASIADDYLHPRKDLNRFAVENWIRRIFLKSLDEKIAASSFVFGLGRLFSSYNDLGIQHATDVDLNLIVEDSVSEGDYTDLYRKLSELKGELHRRFGIILDLHPDYTLQRESTVLTGLREGDAQRRFEANLFYRTNERGICILKDHPTIREKVFAPLRRLPDAVIFEHFLGLSGTRPSFAKIRTDAMPLSIGLDGTCERIQVRSVIGSRNYGISSRRLFPLGLFVSPPEWFFSMKYFVNRVYDYVCAMRTHGRSLEEIGFNSPLAKDGIDSDYRYLRNAHKLMLHLQELIQTKIGAYGCEVDYSWMSAKRFKRLIEIGGDNFRDDFDAMVLDGKLLLPSDAERYKTLRSCILNHATDRIMEGKTSELAKFPKDFHYQTINKDADRYSIRIPYDWADLGYFAFNAIGSRLARIVESRLLPALPALGMPKADYERYRKALSGT
ncbi:hypothetical protein MASR2M78_29120 [Treponema sp.]